MDVTPIFPVMHSHMEQEEMNDAKCSSSLEGNSQDDYDSPFKLQVQAHRVLRKRSLQTRLVSTSKRRFSLKPKKVLASTDKKNSENFYLESKFKLTRKASLETIYEEPVTGKDGSVKYSGPAKLRRLNFDSIARSKIKKRKTKIKKVLGGKRLKKQRMSMDEFISKLRGISTKVESEEIAALFTTCEIK